MLDTQVGHIQLSEITSLHGVGIMVLHHNYYVFQIHSNVDLRCFAC